MKSHCSFKSLIQQNTNSKANNKINTHMHYTTYFNRCCLNATIKENTGDMEDVFYNEALKYVIETSCRDMVLDRGNKHPKVLPQQISSKREQLKLLHIAVKKEGSVAVNKVESPRAMKPPTPDPKNPATKSFARFIRPSPKPKVLVIAILKNNNNILQAAFDNGL